MATRRFHIGCVLLLVASQAVGQDTIGMREFILEDSVQVPLEGSFHYTLDSLAHKPEYANLSMAEVLSTETSLYIKSVGPGMLATPSFRGGDANHTVIMWNGAKLNSPMLGTMDMSLIPGDMFNTIEVYTGASSNLYSSGGMGGGISLGGAPDFNQLSASARLSTGSFGTQGIGMHGNVPFKIRQKPVVFKLYADQSASANAFGYLDIFQTPYEQKVMQHAAWQRSNVQMTLTAQPSSKLHLQLSGWLSYAQRELPNPINLTQASEQWQADTSQRMQLRAKYYLRKNITISAWAFAEHNINRFTDPRTQIDNSNEFTSIQSMITLDWRPVRVGRVILLLNQNHVRGSSNNYDHQHQLDAWSAVAKLERNFLKKRLLLEAGGRGELYHTYSTVLPFAGFSAHPVARWPVKVIGSYAKTLRLPTLNELYWSPGGNPDLRPEFGQTAEAGLEAEKQHWKAKAVYFYGSYTDRVRWLPQGAVFSPINIATSTVSGVDARAEFRVETKSWYITPHAMASYTLSEGSLTEDAAAFTISFVPTWQGSAGVAVTRNNIRVRYTHQYTGKRFITNDESAYMPAFHTGNLSFTWFSERWSKQRFQLSSVIYNLWNVNYQNLPWRPMPGRSFQVQLKLNVG